MKLIHRKRNWPITHAFGDAWFDRAFRDFAPLARWFNLPEMESEFAASDIAADLYEDDHHYHVRVELPGARKEEVGVRLENDVLHVAFTRGDGQGNEEVSLTRSFRLPGPVDAEGIRAKMEDGLLTVTLPRREEAKPRMIAIE